jgi:hypothetical protein
MMTLFFCAGPVVDFAERKRPTTAYARTGARSQAGLPGAVPVRVDLCSVALTDDDVARAADAAARFFRGGDKT